ncbi:septum formation initiator family protein [Roseitranquillus sediminis]|uniref:septum formation initiator family protein n=1 Tax=Roseitranquillus sediminis TaxID=2809051 RepID=UPI001D0C33EA|nr:septum formation initiator family protein [Roseitranquillus sediminis]MBM9595243.1 septum formation initiator family protein [Roseitranquillus sediminis]
MNRKTSGLGPLVFLTGTVMLGLYFTFASVQGDYGLFRRLQIEAEAEALTAERDRLRVDVALMTNKARRLSDDFLDLDLLDEQARSVLGMVRADEVVIP